MGPTESVGGNASQSTSLAVLVTGSTSGIGLAIARRLAVAGCHVIIHGPDTVGANRAADTVQEAVPAATIDATAADLSSQQQVRELAAHVAAKCGKLDALVNNAAAVFDRWSSNGDGIELTFAVNYVSVYLLTRLLLPTLEESGDGTIVNVASEAHRGAALDFDDLQNRIDYERFRAYQRSKLADLMFTYELARRVDPARVAIVATHPGTVRTRLFRPRNPIERVVMPILNLRARSTDHGSDTAAWLVTSDEARNLHGRYVGDRQPLSSSPDSYDEAVAARLWKVTAEMTGLPDRLP